MKNSATTFVKQIMSVIRSMAKAKSMAIKSKTNAVRARLIVFSLLRNKKISLGAISDKIHSLLGQQEKIEGGADDESKAIVLYNATASEQQCSSYQANQDDEKIMELDSCYRYHDEDDKYPDLTHSLFDLENDDDLDLGDPNSSVVDLVRNSKEKGEKFSLEDEIDHVADLFILKFHKTCECKSRNHSRGIKKCLREALNFPISYLSSHSFASL